MSEGTRVVRHVVIRGRVQGHSEGYGFLVRDDGKSDCFIGARQMHKVLHGDRVMAREIASMALCPPMECPARAIRSQPWASITPRRSEAKCSVAYSPVEDHSLAP